VIVNDFVLSIVKNNYFASQCRPIRRSWDWINSQGFAIDRWCELICDNGIAVSVTVVNLASFNTCPIDSILWALKWVGQGSIANSLATLGLYLNNRHNCVEGILEPMIICVSSSAPAVRSIDGTIFNSIGTSPRSWSWDRGTLCTCTHTSASWGCDWFGARLSWIFDMARESNSFNSAFPLRNGIIADELFSRFLLRRKLD
jgi:hypothetical protein